MNGEKNGKGTEFEDEEMIFKGEFKNGERWTGKGKKYKGSFDIKNIVYEGTYFEGKRMKENGEEYQDGKLIYKGSYSDGKRWNGKGK